jgi:uncharacterized protein
LPVLQMLPMVPSQRQNMIAWLAARSDQPDYGKLIVYEFPKEKLVYGPFQIEALINQSTEISRQLSRRNQMGSRVIRGNLLVIPIENSILYVSPLYLRAKMGQLPELKRVIAAYGDRVVMDETLAALIQGARPGRPARGGTGQNRARRPRGRSRAGGAEPLQWRYPAAEIRQLGRLWCGTGRAATTARGVEPALRRS